MKTFLRNASCQGQHTLLFWLCALAYTCAYLGRLNYSACLVEIIADCGFTRAQGGMIGTAFFVVYGCGQLLNGFLGDRLAPQRMIFAGLLGSALANLAFGLARGAAVMAAIWCLNGFFQSLLWSPIVRIFAEWFRPEYRKTACMRINLAVPLGTVGAYLLAVLFLKLGSWRGQFYLCGVLLLVMAFVWRACLNPLCGSEAFVCKTNGSQGGAVQPAAKTGLLPLLCAAGFPLFLFALVAQGVLKDGITTWVPTYTQETYGLTAALSVFGTMFLPLVNLLGVYLASWLDRRVFKNELAATGALFLLNTGLVGLLFFVRGAGPWAAYLLLALSTTTMMGANTLLASFLPAAFAPWGKTSSAAGVINFCIYVGCALSVWGTGLMSDRLGWGATIGGWAVLSGAGLACCLLAAGRWAGFRVK